MARISWDVYALIGKRMWPIILTVDRPNWSILYFSKWRHRQSRTQSYDILETVYDKRRC